MQRKNYTLKRYRSGMALIMAIAVIVILSTIMALSLSLTTLTSKRTTDMYLYEQSALLAKSATELTLSQIAKDGPCTHTDDPSYTLLQDIYNVTTTVRYVYITGANPCDANKTFTTVTTPEQNGSILIDVSVSVTDANVSSEPIRYFRRTLQKL